LTVGWREEKRRRNERRPKIANARLANCPRHGFTLVELLVVMVIIGLLAALLLPALSSAKANAKQAACLGNLRQLEAAFQMYANDNGGYLTQNVSFVLDLIPTFGTTRGLWQHEKRDRRHQCAFDQGRRAISLYSQTLTYRCPADPTVDNGAPRVRSYVMNG